MSLRVDYTKLRLTLPHGEEVSGQIKWKSPSNIALIKYWGKHGVQLPRNPSISFTLNAACSTTSLQYERKTGSDKGLDLQFYFEGKKNQLFEDRVRRYLESIRDIYPFLDQLKMRFDSTNSFPHSSGIASSASGMSALALCLGTLEYKLFKTLEDDSEFRQKVSYLARLASGSASRSIFPKMALWGKILEVEASSDEYAVPMEDHVHPVFESFRDSILIVSGAEKSTSSRAGHALMDTHPFATQRYSQARQHMVHILDILQEGNTDLFVEIVENEALTLHALMMSSGKSFILMKPGTLQIIESIRQFRSDTNIPICFTLDAGPNVHVLYPEVYKEKVLPFIQSELLPFCENGRWIDDACGAGPVEVE